MKITTLELEKLRLSKAREHALRRIGEIDGRLRELEEQKAALLSCLRPARSGAGHAASAPGGCAITAAAGTAYLLKRR